MEAAYQLVEIVQTKDALLAALKVVEEAEKLLKRLPFDKITDEDAEVVMTEYIEFGVPNWKAFHPPIPVPPDYDPELTEKRRYGEMLQQWKAHADNQAANVYVKNRAAKKMINHGHHFSRSQNPKP